MIVFKFFIKLKVVCVKVIFLRDIILKKKYTCLEECKNISW